MATISHYGHQAIVDIIQQVLGWSAANCLRKFKRISLCCKKKRYTCQGFCQSYNTSLEHAIQSKKHII